jgi:glycerol-3-phosphate dehydrogenase
LYDLFSRKSLLPKSKWLDRQEALIKNPELNSNGLIGGYEYYDVQMDDYALGMWVAKNAKKKGVKILSNQEVLRVTSDGLLQLTNEMIQHDYVINLAGPWALKLLEDSKIKIPYKLDIVRGSHLIIDYEIENSYILEVPNERRIFFVLPWKNKTLIGTTECRQDIKDKIFCSKNEIEYLINSFRFYFKNIDIKIIDSFSGLRPLIYSHKDPNKATREYVILRDGKLINVLGGKWTTSMALAKKVAAMINK